MYVLVKTSDAKGTILYRGFQPIIPGIGQALYEIQPQQWPTDPSTGEPARKDRCFWNTDTQLPALKSDLVLLAEYRKKRFLEVIGVAGQRDLFLITKKNLTGQPNYDYDSLRAAAKTFYQNLQTDTSYSAIDARCAAAYQALGLDNDDI